MSIKKITIRLNDRQQDLILIHAAHHKIKKPTTMVQIIFEEGLEMRDGMLKPGEEKQ